MYPFPSTNLSNGKEKILTWALLKSGSRERVAQFPHPCSHWLDCIPLSFLEIQLYIKHQDHLKLEYSCNIRKAENNLYFYRIVLCRINCNNIQKPSWLMNLRELFNDKAKWSHVRCFILPLIRRKSK